MLEPPASSPQRPSSLLCSLPDDDARLGISLLSMICTTLTCLLWVVFLWYPLSNTAFDYDVVLQPSNANNRIFYSAMIFAFMAALPALIDLALLSVFLGMPALDLHSPRETSRVSVMLFIVIPNVFVLLHLVPASIVDFVMFCQYVCLFYTAIFRVLSLATTQKIVSHRALRPVFYVALLTIVCAFLYKLSTHGVLGGELALKVLYTVCLVVLHLLSLRKMKEWMTMSSRLSKITAARNFVHNNTVSFACLAFVILSTLTLTVTHIVLFQENVIFFPTERKYSSILQWVFFGILLVWTTSRNFEVRKGELATTDQLIYHRKMTRSISHEIRTPLNTAFMALDLLISSLAQPSNDEHSSPASLLEIAESIKEGCDIALAILNQLLTFEKLSAGMMQLENKLVSVRELLDSNMKLFKMQAQQSGITFKLESGEMDMDLFFVYVDENKMNQVLRNLLSNAMKFTPRGGVVEVKLLWIRDNEREAVINRFTNNTIRLNNSNTSRASSVQSFGTNSLTSTAAGAAQLSERETSWAGSFSRWWRRPYGHNSESAKVVNLNSTVPLHANIAGTKHAGTILISVVDSGPGVSKADQKKLFQEYVQINPGELQKGQGTGLGLSISKSIVHLHGGNIGMTSEGKGKGSTFYVELPAYRATGDISRPDLIDASPHSLKGKFMRTVSRRTLVVEATDPHKRSNNNSNSNPNNNHNVAATNATNGAVPSSPNGSHSHRSLLRRFTAAFTGSRPHTNTHTPRPVHEESATELEREEREEEIVQDIEANSRSAHLLHPHAPPSHSFSPFSSHIYSPNSSANTLSGISRGNTTHITSAAPISAPLTQRDMEPGAGADTKAQIDAHAVPPTGTLLHNLFATPGSKIIPSTSQENAHSLTTLPSTAWASAGAHTQPHTALDNTSTQTHSKTTSLTVSVEPLLSLSNSLSHSHSAENKTLRERGKEKDETEHKTEETAFGDARPLLHSTLPHTHPHTLPSSSIPHSPSPQQRRLSSRQSFFTPPRPYNILIVDDSAPNRKMLARLLLREKHVVTQAENGAEGLEIVTNNMLRRAMAGAECMKAASGKRRGGGRSMRVRTVRVTGTETETNLQTQVEDAPPQAKEQVQSEELSVENNDCGCPPPAFDLILMDYYMPAMNGPEAIAAMRKLGFNGMIVGVSGVMDDDVNDFVKAGANLVLCKPITLNVLWKALRSTDFFQNTITNDISSSLSDSDS